MHGDELPGQPNGAGAGIGAAGDIEPPDGTGTGDGIGAGDDIGPGDGIVVIGATTLARRVCAALGEGGHPVDHLAAPDDQDLRRALAGRPAHVAVLVGDDLSALRYALAVRHVSGTVRIVATVFDRTVAQQLQSLLRRCVTVSPADILAPTLAGLCAEPGDPGDAGEPLVPRAPGAPSTPGILAVWPDGDGALAVRRHEEGLVETAWRPSPGARRRALLGRLRGQLQPHDADARLLLIGLLGIATVLALDWLWLVVAFHKPASTAFLEAARVVAGVGPAAPHEGHPVYEVISGIAMLVTVGFTAVLTAGIVDRLFGPRLVGVLGPRVLPRSGHVIVVGLGQVGLRLCQTLRQLGVPVIGVEREPAAPNLRLARSMGIPVVLAHGEDREVLARLGLARAHALAAVGSEDLDNIAVAVAAHGVAPDIRVVLRAGEDEAIAETRSLLPLGHTRDITRTSAAYVTAHLTGTVPRRVVADTDCDYVDLPGSGLTPWPVPARDDCGHITGGHATGGRTTGGHAAVPRSGDPAQASGGSRNCSMASSR
ncbi:portal protein [Streptomyces piniterrae]|uniref:Portal protein n=1 Tax=Streptomyces piniterrae TaxID=2571125 RepID=A0A4U0N917_9ACTN|nr:NAD(P)-binding protein [Streptomyces piniterrae]TJZ50371.1 portal protein [Streptomyces piniterrae]